MEFAISILWGLGSAARGAFMDSGDRGVFPSLVGRFGKRGRPYINELK